MSGVTYNENLDGIGIDDIRNGFCGSPAIHVSFDTRNTVILKVYIPFPHVVCYLYLVLDAQSHSPNNRHPSSSCSRFGATS